MIYSMLHFHHFSVFSVLNYVARQGGTTASAMGTIGRHIRKEIAIDECCYHVLSYFLALLYSLIGTGISWARGADDELNTISSGTVTGLVYRSTTGLFGSLRGGLYGLGATSLYVLLTSKDRLKAFF